QQEWISRRSLVPQLSPITDPLHAREPSMRMHRFAWGDFSALSYVWGESTPTLPKHPFIVLNGRLRSVTPNLAAALARFAEAGEFDDSGCLDGRHKLWVDALCINQDDPVERAAEVRRMRDIYGLAWSVVAWLGEPSFGSARAMQLLRTLGGLARSGRDGTAVEAALRADASFLGCGGAWLALHELMNRPYWSRLWIVQEMIMGASATWLRCGDEWVDWRTFCDGVAFLEEHLWLVKDDLFFAEKRAMGDGSARAWQVRGLHLVYLDLSMLGRREEEGGEYPSFGRLLDIANSADCKDSTDKAYALVGLMPPQVAKKLEPDYTIPVSDAYAVVARTFIEVYDNLEPLREGNPWGPAATPTWAADWSWRGRLRWARPEGPLWGPPQFFPRRGPKDAANDDPFRASGDVRHDTVFSPDGLLLTCSGFILDRITGLSARGMRYFAWDQNSVVPDVRWESAYGDALKTREALCRTLLMDRASTGRAESRHGCIFHLPITWRKADREFGRRGWQWLAGQQGYYFRWEGFWAANKNMRFGDYQLKEFLKDDMPTGANEFDFSEAYSVFDRTTQKRRLMFTRGGYMGWAPDNICGAHDEQTRVGDLIAIVFGCSTPLVIRQHGSHFQVLGEAYVQGWMDGQAIALMRAENINPQKFTFC
ncbi:heterokaryon incompatibility protein-domain-containing protein, partial [Immersiella caudata]